MEARAGHRSFTMTDDCGCWRGDAAANQPQSIRAEIRFWRVVLRREACNRENFFIAKNRDSESARRPFERFLRSCATSITQRSLML
jgi:hypothetical protein